MGASAVISKINKPDEFLINGLIALAQRPSPSFFSPSPTSLKAFSALVSGDPEVEAIVLVCCEICRNPNIHTRTSALLPKNSMPIIKYSEPPPRLNVSSTLAASKPVAMMMTRLIIERPGRIEELMNCSKRLMD